MKRSEVESPLCQLNCQVNDKVIHDKGTHLVALPQSQAGERNHMLFDDEGTAFVALLRACTKNKDLSSGTKIHDAILKRGLLEKCSDALVTMYAKCGAFAKAKALLDMYKSRDVISWTALIAGYAREKQSQDAFNCYECMQHQGILPNAVTYACILKACGNMGAAEKGKQIHDEIARQGLLPDNIVLGNALVDMYAKCGALTKAKHVLEELPSRDVVSWSALIAGYAQHGQGEHALDCLEHMQHEGIPPNAVTYACILKACGTIGAADKGKQIHDEIARQGLLRDNIVLGSALVDMYAKCGDLAKAQCVLEDLPSRGVVSWSALISGYAQHGLGEHALNCFEHMQHEGIPPDAVTYTLILKACGTMGAIDKGKLIHDEIARQGLLQDNIVLGNALVDMYAKCGAMENAQHVLEELPSRDVVSWSSLIAGYAQHGLGEQALNCYECMQCEGIPPNAVTYACILKACGTIADTEKGKQIHGEIARQGLLRDNIVLGNALVDMYANCGALVKAQCVLEELPSRDVVSWSALIAGYAQYGQGEQALNCFECMQREGILPDAVTYACILKACGILVAADKGKEIHDEIVRQGLGDYNVLVGNALVDMYAKCGVLEKAQHVLDELPSRDVVAWNALIAGYAQEGQGEQARNCFERMQNEGVPPNAVTYTCILKACGTIGASDIGKHIHDEIASQGLLRDNIVLGTALVDMYAKCSALAKAQRVLEELPFRDVISWSALIAGYAQQGQGEQALNCLERMQLEGVPPNSVTYACILKACGSIGAADKGRQIHDEILRHGLLRDNIVLGNALVDMYAKCGALAKAQCVLEELPSRNVVSWNALIAGFSQQGQGEQALNCFQRMQLEGIPPDAVTFCCVLNVCSHLGLVEEGHRLFMNMSTKYGIEPNLEAYTCMIDLFGRAGHLEKAERLIREIPFSDYSAIWHALLGACRKWGDANFGRWAFDQAVQVDKRDGAAHVLMANIYTAAGMEEHVKEIEAMGMENQTWKKPGRSLLIRLSGCIHDFSVGDTKHGQSKIIYSTLDDFAYKMSQQGYSLGMHWVSAKKHLLCYHSAKLALHLPSSIQLKEKLYIL